MKAHKVQLDLRSLSDLQKSKDVKRFFKTKKGEYGEGDVFIGVAVPKIRNIAQKYFTEITLTELESLLHSKVHEERMCALFILVAKFQKSKDPQDRSGLVNFYINPQNIKYVNNWDLVDSSCYQILGEYLYKNTAKIEMLYDFARSDDLWVKRIAIVSTMTFVRNNIFEHTIAISKILLKDKHDLIRKAVGWLLREVGKKNKHVLLEFLDNNHKEMARISLSYAIERLTKEEKERYKTRKSN